MVVNILITIIALLHVYFLILEMFFWDKPKGLKTFGHNLATAKASKVLAMNMGLYNGFLAAGLFWSLYLGPNGYANSIFFLSCVVVAGIFGALTANRKILFVQAFPAIIALGFILF